MTTEPNAAMRDQMLAEVELAQQRLHEISSFIEDQPEDVRAGLTEQEQNIESRCGLLADQIREWPEIRIGTATAIQDLSSALDALEADIGAIGPVEREGYRSRVDRQLRAWKARAEYLRLETSLGSMEARDELEEISNKLSHARAGALVDLKETIGDAKDVVVDLRENIEELLVDVRHAVERAADALVHRKD